MGFLSFIPIIGKLFDTVGSITSKLQDTKVALARVTSEEERVRLEVQEKALEARLSGLIASQRGPLGWMVGLVQGIMGLTIAFLLVKLAVYDKALGQWTQGHTDPLGKDLWDMVKLVVGFYFVTTWIKG